MSLTLAQKRRLLGLIEPTAGLVHRALRRLKGQPGRCPVPAKPTRIAVVRLDTIGDVLLSEPAIGALRQAYPQARIEVICNGAGKAVLEGNSNIDEFIVYAAPWHAAWRGARVSWRAELVKLLRVVADLRQREYDVAFELRGDFRDIAFAALTGAHCIVGNSWRGGKGLLDLDAPVDLETHRVEFTCDIVLSALRQSLPAPETLPTPRPPRLYLTESERAKAAAAVPDPNAVVLHLGAGFASKCLPIPKFGAVAEAMHARGRTIVIIGGPEDRRLLEQLRQVVRFDPIDLVGRLSLRETAAVIERAALFIGNDSGPMHLAAAVGTPVVTFFGPSEPWKYHPYGVEYAALGSELPCRPCDHVHCVHREFLCMTSIPVDDIVNAADRFLTAPPASERPSSGERATEVTAGTEPSVRDQ